MKRRWPTVPDILVRASEVHERSIGVGPAVYFVDATTGEHVTVHMATVPNLLKTIRGSWPAEQDWQRTIYRKPKR